MALITEDGTGKTDSNGYITKDDFTDYWTDRGIDYTTIADATLDAWIVIATEYIDNHYKFYGDPTTPDTQALQWPRTGTRDSKRNLVDSDEIPKELKYATCRLGSEAKKNPDMEILKDTGVKSKKIGPVSVTYNGSANSEFRMAYNLLRGFISNNSALRTKT